MSTSASRNSLHRIPALLLLALLATIPHTSCSRRVPVEDCIQKLSSTNAETRAWAAGELGTSRDERAVEPLSAAIGDRDLRVGLAAVDALGAIGGDRAVGHLITALGHKHVTVKIAAAEALGGVEDSLVVVALARALNDDNPKVRVVAADALGRIGGEPAVDALSGALRQENPFVRWAAARALGETGRERALGPLIRALRDEGKRSYVRRAILYALDELDADWRNGADGTAAVNDLIADLKDKEIAGQESWSERHAIGAVLDEIEPDWREREDVVGMVPELIGRLTHEQWLVRKAAAQSLGKIRDARAVEPLIGMVRNAKSLSRGDALLALGEIGDARAVYVAVAALSNEDHFIASTAIVALGMIGDSLAVRPLTRMLGQDPSLFIRRRAAEALGRIGHRRAVEPLVGALDDEAPLVRGAAARALGTIGDAASVPALVEAVEMGKAEVRRAAVMALGRIGDSRAIRPLVQALGDVELPVEGTVEALDRIDSGWQKSETAARLARGYVGRLEDREPYVRKGAAAALAAIADKPSTEALERELFRRNLPVIAGAYPYFVRRGIRGSEYGLIQALNTYGDGRMCTRFLNCGNRELVSAAKSWIRMRGLSTLAWPDSTGFDWDEE